MAEQGHSSGPTDAKSASTAFPGPRPKESEGKDIIPDPLGIKSTFSFGTMTHCQQSWQIPEFSSLGCWKHWHGYVPPLELNQPPAILPFVCFFLCPCVISLVPIVPSACPTPYTSSSCPRIFQPLRASFVSRRLISTEQSQERYPQVEMYKKQKKKANPACSLRPNQGNQPPGSGSAKDKVSVYGGGGGKQDGYRDIGCQETDSDGPIHPVGWRRD